MFIEIIGRRKGAVTLIGPTFLEAPPLGLGSAKANSGSVEPVLVIDDEELCRLTDPEDPLATS